METCITCVEKADRYLCKLKRTAFDKLLAMRREKALQQEYVWVGSALLIESKELRKTNFPTKFTTERKAVKIIAFFGFLNNMFCLWKTYNLI